MPRPVAGRGSAGMAGVDEEMGRRGRSVDRPLALLDLWSDRVLQRLVDLHDRTRCKGEELDARAEVVAGRKAAVREGRADRRVAVEDADLERVEQAVVRAGVQDPPPVAIGLEERLVVVQVAQEVRKFGGLSDDQGVRMEDVS